MNISSLRSFEKIWEVEINYRIQSASLDDLVDWAKAGKLQPKHKVRIKNLNWMEAQTIQTLSKIFDNKNSQLFVQDTPRPDPPKTEIWQPPPSTVAALPPEKQSFFSAPIKIEQAFETTPDENSWPIETKTPDIKIDSKEILKPSAPQNPEPGFKKTLPKTAFKKIENKSKSIKKLFETTILCPTCYYFCRYVPLLNYGIPFSCPICHGDCISIHKKNTYGRDSYQSSSYSFRPSERFFSAGLLIGSFLIFLLALAGSYLWIFQIRPPVEVDGKNITEVVVIEEKFNTDKVGLRIKWSALEENQNNVSMNGYSQELAKLQSQYVEESKNIIEKHQNVKTQKDFEKTLISIFFVLMVLYLLTRKLSI